MILSAASSLEVPHETLALALNVFLVSFSFCFVSNSFVHYLFIKFVSRREIAHPFYFSINKSIYNRLALYTDTRTHNSDNNNKCDDTKYTHTHTHPFVD